MISAAWIPRRAPASRYVGTCRGDRPPWKIHECNKNNNNHHDINNKNNDLNNKNNDRNNNNNNDLNNNHPYHYRDHSYPGSCKP